MLLHTFLQRFYSLSFQTLIRPAGRQVLVFFGAAARPIDHHAINLVALAQSKSERKLGLRKVTGASAHHARLMQIASEDLHVCTDSLAIGFRSLQFKAD